MAKIKDAVTPQVIVQYPWLTKADVKYDPEGAYQAECILDPNNPKHAKFMEDVDVWLNQAKVEAEERLGNGAGKMKAKLKTLVEAEFLKPEYDDEGEETGRMTFRVKQKRIIRFKDKKTGEAKAIIKKIVFLDSTGAELVTPPAIFSGAELQIKGQVATYYAADKNKYGISMKIMAVRIVFLPEGSGQTSDMSRGFEDRKSVV